MQKFGGSTPYFQYGYQRRYPYAWHGGPGGVPNPTQAGEVRSLSNFNLEESGLTPYSISNPSLQHTRLHDPMPIGDWPPVRSAGPEPLHPGEGAMGLFETLSDNEKKLAMVLGAGAALYFFLRHKRKNRRR